MQVFIFSMLELSYPCSKVHISNMLSIYHYSQECVDLFFVSEQNLNLNHITWPLDKIWVAQMKSYKSGSGVLNQCHSSLLNDCEYINSNGSHEHECLTFLFFFSNWIWDKCSMASDWLGAGAGGGVLLVLAQSVKTMFLGQQLT